MTDHNMITVMDTYPDQVAEALMAWRKASLEKSRVHAREYLKLKAESEGQERRITQAELEARVVLMESYYQAALADIVAESAYTKLYEQLMSAKKQASIRAAF